MDKDKNKDKSNTSETKKDNTLLGWIKYGLQFIKKHIIGSFYFHISLILFIVVLPIIYYVFLFNPSGVLSNNAYVAIIISLLVIFSFIVIILPGIDPSLDPTRKKQVAFSFLQYYKLIGYVLILFFMFAITFHISKYIIYESLSKSILLSVIVSMLLITIYYNTIIKPYLSQQEETKRSNTKSFYKPQYGTYEFMTDIIFYIPCLINDTLDLIRKYVIKGLPGNTSIITGSVLLIGVFYYLIPFTVKYFKETYGVVLIKKQTELNRTILSIDQDTLNRKVVESKPFPQKQLLRTTYGGMSKESYDNMRNVEVVTPSNMNAHILDQPDNGDNSDEVDDDQSLVSLYKQMIEKPIEWKDELEELVIGDDGMHKAMRQIKQYNDNKNDFIDQQQNELVKYINNKNGLTTYNYHYGLSMWVYFDSKIAKRDNDNKFGLILNYANKPRLYFNFETKELVVDVEKCKLGGKNGKMKCENVSIYKTKDILYQKWNNIVINYNYGTLDIFINNNLVSTFNDLDPYIDPNNNALTIGSEDNPLPYCGICNVTYNNKPYNLLQIMRIYSNKESPCV